MDGKARLKEPPTDGLQCIGKSVSKIQISKGNSIFYKQRCLKFPAIVALGISYLGYLTIWKRLEEMVF